MAKARAGCDAMYMASQGSGEPVLFLHGIPTSSRLWSGVIARMTNQFTCMAVDLPGLGRTSGTPEGFRDLTALADRLESLRIEHNVERWHLVGHDAGCAIAVRYAHRYRRRVHRLALLTPSIFPDLKPFPLFEVLRKPLLGELAAPAVNLFFWTYVMRKALDPGPHHAAALRDFYAPFRGPCGAWRLMSLLRWGNPAEVLASVPAQLAELAMPALIFHGLHDKAVPERFASRAARLLPNAEEVLLECGHFLPMSHPAAIADRLLSFFGAQDALPLDSSPPYRPSTMALAGD